MTPEKLRQALADEGQRKAKAEAEREESMTHLRKLIRLADGVLPVAETARLAGVTRQTVYDLRA